MNVSSFGIELWKIGREGGGGWNVCWFERGAIYSEDVGGLKSERWERNTHLFHIPGQPFRWGGLSWWTHWRMGRWIRSLEKKKGKP